MIEASNDFLISEKSYKYLVLNFVFKYSLRIVLLKGSCFKYFITNESKVYNDNDDVLHINQCLSLSKSKLEKQTQTAERNQTMTTCPK